MDIKATFTRKIGPLPMWAWAVGGGVGIGLYIRHRRATQVTATSDTTSTDTSSDVSSPYTDSLASGIPGDFAGGGYSGPSASDLSDAVAAGLATWQAQQPAPVTTDPNAPGVAQQAPVPIAITVQSAPTTLHGGGPPVAPARRVQIAPRAPAPVPRGTSPNRADTGVTHNGVDEGTLNAAMGITGRAGYPRVERSTMADRMRAHPDWGPYTLAHNGPVRGHSTRF